MEKRSFTCNLKGSRLVARTSKAVGLFRRFEIGDERRSREVCERGRKAPNVNRRTYFFSIENGSVNEVALIACCMEIGNSILLNVNLWW